MIEQSQTPEYVEAWKQFARQLLAPFGISERLSAVLGPNLGIGVDSFFETRNTTDEIDQAIEALSSCGECASAQVALQANELHSLCDAVRLQIALISVGGSQCLREQPHLQENWQARWSGYLHQQNTQQALSRQWVLADIIPEEQPLEEALETYQSRFSQMDAIAITLVAACAFSSSPAAHFAVVSPCLETISSGFRMLADLSYDPKEDFNAGVYAIAASQQCKLSHAVALLAKQPSLYPLSPILSLLRPFLDELQSLTDNAPKTLRPTFQVLKGTANTLIKRAKQQQSETKAKRNEA